MHHRGSNGEPGRPKTPASLALLLALLVVARPQAVRAEDSIAYKYADYRETGGRIHVQTNSALVEQDLGTDMHLKLGGVIDSIAGATPTGEPAPAGSDQVVLSELRDLRRAWNAEFSRQFSRVNLAAGFARSMEHDYVSNGWSINSLTDFNQKNTTVLAGVAGTHDEVEVFFKPAWLDKRTNDVIVGVTQLLDPLTSVSADLTWGRSTGFLNDQYKLVLKNIQILPGLFLPQTFAESRPDWRNKATAFFSLNRAFPDLKGAFEGSYRFYHDTFGVTAHTAEFAWLQRIGGHWIVEPTLRVYSQTAASFYYYRLDGTAVIPTRIPNPQAPHYSSDARLSAFRSADYGLKVIWKPAEWIQFDLALEGYRQRGTDGVTPQSAYYRARITSAGAKILW